MRESIPQGRVAARYRRLMVLRTIARTCVGIALSIGAACGGGGSAGDGDCPEGMDRMAVVAVDPSAGPLGTREQAVRARLREVDRDASDEAISAALFASTPGDEAGTERIVVEASDGVEITMVLVPRNPGWDVTDTEWCAPTADGT
jgi:hypothetical protein